MLLQGGMKRPQGLNTAHWDSHASVFGITGQNKHECSQS